MQFLNQVTLNSYHYVLAPWHAKIKDKAITIYYLKFANHYYVP